MGLPDWTRPGSARWAAVSIVRELPPRLFLALSLAIAIYVAIALMFHRWGDIRTSCRVASEIAVDGSGQIYCSLPTQAAINVFTAEGAFVRHLPLDTLGGGFSLYETPDGQVGAYLFRANRQVVFSADGAVVPPRGPLLRLPEFPTTRVEKGGVAHVLENGEVYRVERGRRALVVASHTPWFVPSIPWMLIAPSITALGSLLWWATRRWASS